MGAGLKLGSARSRGVSRGVMPKSRGVSRGVMPGGGESSRAMGGERPRGESPGGVPSRGVGSAQRAWLGGGDLLPGGCVGPSVGLSVRGPERSAPSRTSGGVSPRGESDSRGVVTSSRAACCGLLFLFPLPSSCCTPAAGLKLGSERASGLKLGSVRDALGVEE